MKNRIWVLISTIILLNISVNVWAEPSPGIIEEDKVDERIKKILPKINGAANQLIDEAKDYLAKSKLQDAIKLFTAATTVAPNDPRAYYFLTRIYFLMKKDDLAFQILEKALGYNSQNDYIFEQLAADFDNFPPAVEQEENLISIAAFKDGRKAAISLVFDDGPRNIYDRALPIIDEFGYKVTIAINPGAVHDQADNPWFGGWKEWRDAQRRGHEISNHTVNHKGLLDISTADLEFEVNKAHDLIKEHTGIAPLTFVFPFDWSNARSIAKAHERHIALRDHGFLTKVYKNIFIPVYGGIYFSEKTAEIVVNMALNKRLWIIAECHALTEKGIRSHKPISEEFLRAHLTYLKKNDDKIWVDTFLNVFLYLKERQETRVEIKRRDQQGVSFQLANALDPKIYSYPLTVVIHPASPPQKVKAGYKGKKELLPAVIRDNKIYIDAVPSKEPVIVSWE